MSENARYFQSEAMQAVLQRVTALVSDAVAAETCDAARDANVWLMDIYRSPEVYDEYCQHSIAILGETLTAALVSVKGVGNPEEWRYVIALLYRFVGELLIRYPREVPVPIRAMYEAVSSRLEQFDVQQRSIIQWAQSHLPRALAAELLHHPAISELKRSGDTVQRLEALNEQIDRKLQKRVERIEELEKALKRLESEYNFVGLAHGFQGMEKSKRSEWRVTFSALIVLAILMLAPLVFEAYYIFRLIDSSNVLALKSILFLAPAAIAIEVLLVYFFRITLLRVRSLDAQLLQLRLRLCLCQFIEGYAEYAETLKKRSDVTLSKFENIIFSGIQTSDEKLPSTFDGMEQLMKLVQQVRGSEGRAVR